MKIYFLSVFVLCTVSTLTAQIEFKPGVKAGVNFSGITNIENANNGIKSSGLTGLHLEATFSIKFTHFYTLQPEFGYSMQGSTVTYHAASLNSNTDSTINNQNETENVALSYLSLPVINKFFIANSGFHAEVGPGLDFLIHSKNIEKPSRLDLSFIAGFGYKLSNGISLNLRYKQGLIDILGQNIDYGNGAETTNAAELLLNKVVQISAAYEFDFSR